MHWRRTEPVQTVGALFVVGRAAKDQLIDAIAGKSALFRALPLEQGEDWAVLFAAPVAETPEPVLPRVAVATPLHEAAKGWWLPVGVELEAPVHAHAALWASLSERCGVAPPAIVVPRLAQGEAPASVADVFLVRDPRLLGEVAPSIGDAGRR